VISHVTLGCDDFDAALAFWSPVMAALGARARFVDRSRPWAGWEPPGGGRPLFIVTAPLDGAPATPGNGTMTALDAPDRATVDAVHALALSRGATCDGPPGLRPAYHAHYYGAYFRDPAGNKVAVVCHRPPGA
jgi:catechol 2,3-dioxygenase-like lactoylglutathione lyase family enzyme